MSAPDFIEPIVGFRAWRIDRGVLVPWSAGAMGAWEPGVNTARCLFVADHPAPVAKCSCGLYALADAEDERLRPDVEAVGAVVAWGDVEVHRTGFRAEQAAIVALALPERCPAGHAEGLRMAALRYGVPLVPVDRLVEAACEHGRPIPFEAIPRTRPATSDAPRLDRLGLSGTAVDDHVEVTIVAEGIRLAPTREAPRGVPVGQVEAGDPVRRGDVVLRVGGDDENGLVFRSPLSGHIGDVDGDVVVLVPNRWEEEAGDVDWGAAGRRAYAAALADLGRRGDAFAAIRTAWIRATEGVRSAADVRAALIRDRARPRFADEDDVYARLGGHLRDRVASPDGRRAAERLPLRILWRLHHPDAALLIDLAGEPRVLFGADEEEADLVLHAAAETADDLLTGRADFASALRARDVQSAAPAGEVLRAASVLKRLHRA